MTPTGRTLVYLRRLGFLAAPVERYLIDAKRTVDLFGIADVVGIHPRDKAVLFVQCTSLAHVGDRLKRIKGRPELPLLLRAGIGVECWGWERRRASGWVCKRVAVRAGDLAGIVLTAPRDRRRRRGERQGELFAGTQN
jgi:hypothetical protein